MGCGQGRRREEVGRLAQIRRRRELLRGRAQTEWNSVWHSTGHLQTWRQRMGKNYSLCYGLRFFQRWGGEDHSEFNFYQSFSHLPQCHSCAKWEELFWATRVPGVCQCFFCINSARRLAVGALQMLGWASQRWAMESETIWSCCMIKKSKGTATPKKRLVWNIMKSSVHLKIKNTRNCTQQELWIVSINRVMISGKRHCWRVSNVFLS